MTDGQQVLRKIKKCTTLAVSETKYEFTTTSEQKLKTADGNHFVQVSIGAYRVLQEQYEVL
jgi:hypothetical protein